MNRPDDDEVINEIAEALDMDESDVDSLKLMVMENHEKARALVETVRNIDQTLSIEHDGEVYVNLAWLATLVLMEGEQVVHGHGGCADHMRVVDWLNTTILAAQKNVEEVDSTDEGVVD